MGMEEVSRAGFQTRPYKVENKKPAQFCAGFVVCIAPKMADRRLQHKEVALERPRRPM